MRTDKQQQTCKVCGRPDKFNFDVPDDIWAAIVPAAFRDRVVCLSCFDEFAAIKGTDYTAHIKQLYFAGEHVSFQFETN